jgi:hypothetical protein
VCTSSPSTLRIAWKVILRQHIAVPFDPDSLPP